MSQPVELGVDQGTMEIAAIGLLAGRGGGAPKPACLHRRQLQSGTTRRFSTFVMPSISRGCACRGYPCNWLIEKQSHHIQQDNLYRQTIYRKTYNLQKSGLGVTLLKTNVLAALHNFKLRKTAATPRTSRLTSAKKASIETAHTLPPGTFISPRRGCLQTFRHVCV